MDYALLTKDHQYDYQSLQIPEIPPVLSLTTDEERAYLYWLANNCNSLDAIVEIGVWYGSSAGYIAAGLRDANSGQPFYCIDRFVCRHTDVQKAAEQNIAYSSKPDSDTLPLVYQHLQPIYPNIALVKSEIDQLTWPWNKPIELLHLDAPKRLKEVLHALTIFAPALIPGKSVIVAQDFLMPRAYALPLTFYALRDSIELAQIPTTAGTMATFIIRKPLIVLAEQLNIGTWSDHQVETAFNFWRQYFTDSEQQKMFDIAQTYYVHDNRSR